MTLTISEIKKQHDLLYESLACCPLYHDMLREAMGDAWPAGSTQFSFATVNMLKWLMQSIEELSVRNGVIIDAGCGNGWGTNRIANLIGHPIIGIDASSVAINQAPHFGVIVLRFYGLAYSVHLRIHCRNCRIKH